MLIREFSTKLNSLAKYVSGVASLDKGKLEVFLDRLKLNIAKDVIVGYNPLKSLLKALGEH